MNIINERVQPARLTLSNLISDINCGNYFIDNSFQRRLVWVEKQKVRLIETILMGYPMPEFYLWQQPVNPETGAQQHSVVDGQQRMSSISQFIGGEWALKSMYLDNKEAQYSGKFWSDLPNECKGRIWNYVVNIRTIPSDINRDGITKLFKRLNETDKSLNPQEIRNSEFNGLFINASEEVANNSLFKSWNIFTDNEKRRMADVTFGSALLIYQRSGISNDTPSNINKVYDLYNDVYEKKDKDLSNTNEILGFVDDLFNKNKKIAKFFSSVVHLYSLFVAIDYLKADGFDLDKVTPKLLDFIEIYKSHEITSYPLILEYQNASQESTRSKKSREKRVENLVDWITS
tara:strand:- start:16739 stop:17776 length:1038 start_codon:yes stop_codon:yes gene_type:complete